MSKKRKKVASDRMYAKTGPSPPELDSLVEPILEEARAKGLLVEEVTGERELSVFLDKIKATREIMDTLRDVDIGDESLGCIVALPVGMTADAFVGTLVEALRALPEVVFLNSRGLTVSTHSKGLLHDGKSRKKEAALLEDVLADQLRLVTGLCPLIGYAEAVAVASTLVNVRLWLKAIANGTLLSDYTQVAVVGNDQDLGADAWRRAAVEDALRTGVVALYLPDRTPVEFDKPVLGVPLRRDETEQEEERIADDSEPVETTVDAGADFAGAVGALKSRLVPTVPVITAEEIAELQQAVERAQTSPPANRAGFVEDVNAILDTHDLRLQLEDGALARLKLVNTSSKGTIQFGLPGDSRGFRRAAFQVIQTSESSLEPSQEPL